MTEACEDLYLTNMGVRDRPKTITSHVATFLACIIALADALLAATQIQSAAALQAGVPRHLQTVKTMVHLVAKPD